MNNSEYDLPFSSKTARQYLKDRIYSAENFASLIRKFNSDFRIFLTSAKKDNASSLGIFSLNTIKLDSENHSNDSWIFTKQDDEKTQLIIPMSKIKDLVEIGFFNGAKKYVNIEELDEISKNESLEKNIMESNLQSSKTISLDEADIHYVANGVDQGSNFSICPYLRSHAISKVLKKEAILKENDVGKKDSQDDPYV